MRLLPTFLATLGLTSAFVFLQAESRPAQGGIQNQPGSESGSGSDPGSGPIPDPIEVTDENVEDSVKTSILACQNQWYASLECTSCGETTTIDGPPRKSKAEAEADLAEMECPLPDTKSYGSIIDNGSLNYIHSSFDYRGEVPSGCAPCGASGAAGPYPAVSLKRTHRYRDSGERSSFGPGTFSNWDASLTLFIGAENKPYVDLFAPEIMGRRRFTQVGNEFRDLTYKASKGLRLYDASNNLTTVKASAVRAEHENLYGLIYEFEFFDLDTARRSGRLTKIRDQDRDIFTLTYVDPVSSTITPSSRKGRFDSVTDSYGQTLTFTHTGNAIRKCFLPNGSVIDYMFWTNNQSVSGYTGDFSYANYLTSITYPDGAKSTFKRVYDANLQKLACLYDDAAASGTERRKTAYLSTMISGYAAVDNNDFDTSETANSVNFFNQSSSLVRLVRNGAGTDPAFTNPQAGQVTYLSIIGTSSAHRYIYEGGGKLKWVNLYTERYESNFRLPAGTSNPYGFLESGGTRNSSAASPA